MGHEERFPPTRLSAGYGFRKETIAGVRHTSETRRKLSLDSEPNTAIPQMSRDAQSADMASDWERSHSPAGVRYFMAKISS
jgi:hypothetical protein